MTTETKNWQRWLALALVCCAFWLGLAASAAAEPQAVDPRVGVVVRLLDGEMQRGWVTAYDIDGFDMTLKTDQAHLHIEWSQIRPDRVLKVYKKILSRDDARGWFNAAAGLYPRTDGQGPGDTALRIAVKADPSLAAMGERLQAGEALTYDDHKSETETQTSETPPQAGDDSAGDAGPRTSGTIQDQFWGELSDELMKSSVEELKARFLEAQEIIGQRLALYEDESDYFLFYSDLPPKEAKQWAGLLDKMYNKLCDMFAIKRGTNIFRGRAVILVFAREADYHRYQMLLHQFDSQGTGGVCWSYGDGHVEVSFYREGNQLNFARVLVHEAVHGFLHRYRSYPRIESWINEGLAEYISSSLVEGKGFGTSDRGRSVVYGLRNLRELKTLGNTTFFTEDGMAQRHIQGWQYPVAQMLTEFMVSKSQKRYRAFIQAIKEGKPWKQALKEDYGVTVKELVSAFGRHLGIRDLQP